MPALTDYLRPAVSRSSCGGWTGIGKHRDHGEHNCRPCRDFLAAYMRRYRARQCVRGLGWPK